MTYNIITEPSSAELVEKQSRFIGRGYPCHSLEDFQVLLKNLQTEFRDASHITYAYQIIDENSGQNLVRFNDDGEPSGTAGKPILNHLQGQNIYNIALFVIRYFGGVKLGAGGLVRAYGGAAKETLLSSHIGPYIETVQLSFTAGYHQQKQVDYAIKTWKAELLDVEYSDKLFYQLRLVKENLRQFMDDMPIDEKAIDIS